MKYLLALFLFAQSLLANDFVGLWVGKDEPLAFKLTSEQDVIIGTEHRIAKYRIDSDGTLKFGQGEETCSIAIENGLATFTYPNGRKYALKKAKSESEYLEAFAELRWDSQSKTIANNLRQILFAAKAYMKENDLDRVTYDELLSDKADVSRSVRSVAGEDYAILVITPKTESLTIKLDGGKSVTYPRPKEKN